MIVSRPICPHSFYIPRSRGYSCDSGYLFVDGIRCFAIAVLGKLISNYKSSLAKRTQFVFVDNISSFLITN